MQIAPHVAAIQSDLAAAAGLGDEATAEAGRRLSEALASSLQLRLLDLLGEAALEVGAQLESGRVDVRLAGREPELVLVAEDAAEATAAAPGGEYTGRISLRLPETLKAAVEAAAAEEGISANSWLVRAIARAVRKHGGPSGRRRLQGYARG
ncbi:MAG TPA: toxin-antitoxin system HicB family antitoxin [Vicinamibacterales bacterium]|nr:toxin-antitoxin system HicB family antitoxin [Vicinamibacterales bacterium]